MSRSAARYLDKRRVPRVRLPALSQLKRAGYRQLHEDTLGRVQLNAFLESCNVQIGNSAFGWQGDRMRVYRRRGKLAALWVIAFDDPKDAKVAADEVGWSFRARAEDVDYMAYFYVNFAVVARNIDAAHHSSVKAEIKRWIEADKMLDPRSLGPG